MTESGGPQLARNNHYVPRAVLRRWSDDGTHLFAYRTLVPADSVPKWRRAAISGIAYQRDLYTLAAGEGDVDDFERMVASDYEAPGLAAIDRLLRRERLSPSDWRQISLFVAAQDVRTPASLLRQIERWNHNLQETIDTCLTESIEGLESARREGRKVQQLATGYGDEFAGVMKVRIDRLPAESGGGGIVSAEVPVGRRLWVASMRHLLKGASHSLAEHRWGIYEPFGDLEWPLTDQPVLKLNWYGPGKYDFKGGWGSPGSEILMPLSPRSLLYVRIGQRCTGRHVFPVEQTTVIQRLLIENAHRWVFARREMQYIEEIRPRVVDLEAFTHEEREWASWHEQQSVSEREDRR